MDGTLAAGFARRFDALSAIGRHASTGGYRRLAWTPEDAAARRWFTAEAADLGLDLDWDANGNVWAWWAPQDASGAAVATGSHLDTVIDGGAFDGALGVVAGLSAVEELRRREVTPNRPLAVVVFADEEGARFDTPCFGSALLAGEAEPADLLDRRDAQGTRLGDAVADAGLSPEGLGAEPARLAGLEAFVEVHVEQGRHLADEGAPVGVGAGIWPHGRWRLSLTGEANHAGTTTLDERRDAMVVCAAAVTAARERAAARGALATVGKVTVEPNVANAVPARVDAWIDARAPDGATLDRLVEEWSADVDHAAADHGCRYAIVSESFSPGVAFDDDVRRTLEWITDAPALATAAGHDAGTLARAVPTGMLFVRNPTGVSHSPAEHAEQADCLAGVGALVDVLEELTRGTRP